MFLFKIVSSAKNFCVELTCTPHFSLRVSTSCNRSARTLTVETCQAAHEQIIKNLQRENAMIATAWYDLTSRLQSNHVVLQRKDQPKSWLNKQRQMVNGK